MFLAYLFVAVFFIGYFFSRKNNLFISCCLGLSWPFFIIRKVFIMLKDVDLDTGNRNTIPIVSLYDCNKELCNHYRGVISYCINKSNNDDSTWRLIALDVFKCYLLTKDNPDDVPLTVITLINYFDIIEQLSNLAMDKEIRRYCNNICSISNLSLKPILERIGNIYGRKISDSEKERAINIYDSFLLGDQVFADFSPN